LPRFQLEREEEFAMKLKAVFLAALLLTPAAALAAPGIVTASVSMRAGPGQGFPTVDRIPGGARVNIHGCIRGDAWCDVSWSGDRGWVSSQYLQYFYRNRYVYLPDYVDVVDVPIVAFELDSYWANYYPGRPWYQRRAYWSSYWQSHARFATQVPAERSARSGNTARFGNTERRAAITEGRTRPGVAQGFTREQRFDRTQGRLAHVNGAGRTLPGAQQPMVRGHEATRFSRPATTPHIAQPNVAHIAQPNMGRVGGPPQNARAQMGGPRAAPAMPQAGGGGAPHVNAAPRAGGGPAGGGAPGREHH
jgi:uncharacterized protein YraI